MALTNEQKAALAYEIITNAANLVCDNWEDYSKSGYCSEVLKDVSQDEIIKQTAKWLNNLPGKKWDNRLNLKESK